MLEKLVTIYLDKLFPGFEMHGAGAFRVIRDSDIEILEEAEDLVRVFETALKRRRRGNVIRLTIDASMPADLRTFVTSHISVDQSDIFIFDGILGLDRTAELIADNRPDLLFEPFGIRFPRISLSTILSNPSMWWCSSFARRRVILR